MCAHCGQQYNKCSKVRFQHRVAPKDGRARSLMVKGERQSFPALPPMPQIPSETHTHSLCAPQE